VNGASLIEATWISNREWVSNLVVTLLKSIAGLVARYETASSVEGTDLQEETLRRPPRLTERQHGRRDVQGQIASSDEGDGEKGFAVCIGQSFVSEGTITCSRGATC
jgi:hypothetical protein